MKTNYVPAVVLGGTLLAFGLYSMRKPDESAPSDLVAQELAEMSRMPLELRTRMLEVGVGIGFTQGSTVMGQPKDQASIDKAVAFADELEEEGFPLVAREMRQAATTAQNRLKVY